MPNLTDKGKMVLGKLLRAEKEGSIQELDKEILEDLKQAAGISFPPGPSLVDYGKAALESAAETVTAPGRAGRAAAVAYKTAKDLPDADYIDKGPILGPDMSSRGKAAVVEAAKRALSPQYKPEAGEGAASLIGTVAGDIPALAAGGALVKAPKLAGPLYRMLRGGAEGATLGASQAIGARETPAEVAKTAATGGVGGLAGTGAAEVAGYGARAAGGVLRGQASSGIGANVLDKVADSAKDLRGAWGSAKNVTSAAKSLVSQAEKSRASAGALVGAVRKSAGLPSRTDAAMIEFLENSAPTADELADSIRTRVKQSEAIKAGPPEGALRFLDELKHDLDKLIGWSKLRSAGGGLENVARLDEAALIALRNQTKDAIAALPLPSAKALAKAEEAFSKKADAYAVLRGALKTEGSAEGILRTLASGNLERSGLTSGLSVGKLTDVETAAKALGLTKVVKKGYGAAAANLVKTAVPPAGVLQNLLRATGPTGVARTYGAGKALEDAGKVLPGSKAAVAGGKNLADALKRRK